MQIKRYLLQTILLTFLATLCACGSSPDWDMDKPIVFNGSKSPNTTKQIQIFACNLERGFHSKDFVEYIKTHSETDSPPILLLSELDQNHSRTGDRFVARELAETLNMNMVYVPEFIEYNDKTPETQGNIGNAILSPYPLSNLSVIRHHAIYSWTTWGWTRGEPRYGDRVSIGATISLSNGTKIRVYSVHFESTGNPVGRWLQMKEVIDDLEKHKLPSIIGGDFNETALGLMFFLLPGHNINNAFKDDKNSTGFCRIKNKKVVSFLKLDWIVYRGLTLTNSKVDYPVGTNGKPISDHAPIQATFELP